MVCGWTTYLLLFPRMDTDDTLPDRIIRPAELVEFLGVSKPTIHRWRKAGTFPEPIRMGPRSIGWLRTTIQEWLDARPAA